MRIRLPFAFGFLLILLAASSAGLLPHSSLPQAPVSAQPYIPKQSDKVLHFVTFFALTATFYFIFDTARKRLLHLTLVVCTLVLGIGSEVAQGLLPNDREFDAWDVLTNVVGSLCALGLAATYHKRNLERRRRAKYSALTGEGIEGDDEDVELGQTSGPGVAGNEEGLGQETGVVEVSRSKTEAVEEELDNWDENQPDDWDDDDENTTTGAKMTPATSSADSSEELRRKEKVAVD
ncbi:hypothetical protein LTS08_006828 [Lithohypha guttulata]|uniref:VanZ-like domain-containing protein n=1 Tax=Lithohypha guttulata TaxID=1690604 RepID=A0AAN7TB50_9EURO|nr:hypothetical protein LTR51_001882 [Lithohypha guttulata]KAK5090386.1 hypothetical protein LTR05_000558 [Lithohypha guttulata]KAK5097416.1 hypothetical protein LTS08_006828 [Lithohypha guttulata]